MIDLPLFGKVEKETWNIYCKASRVVTSGGLSALAIDRYGRRRYYTDTTTDYVKACVGIACLTVLAPTILPTVICAPLLVGGLDLILD